MANLLGEDTRDHINLLDRERDPTFLRSESRDVDVLALISGREGGSDDDEDEDDDPLSPRGGFTQVTEASAPPVVSIQSMDFEETESYTWRMNHTRRFYHDIGNWWTSTRRTTAWKWVLVVTIGFLVGVMGVGVHELTSSLNAFKFDTTFEIFNKSTGDRAVAFFVFVFISIFFALVACGCCIAEPGATGSGIPEVKSYLNGVNLNKIVRVRILPFKLIGMCFSCASGLPLGKEGPMIHCGSVTGAAVSQGKTFTFGYDTSWTKFQG